MGWSDWIISAPLYLIPDIVSYSESPLTPSSAVVVNDYLHAAQSTITWSTYAGAPFDAHRSGVVASPKLGWESERDWYPSALFPLTEGVDFSVRPDRTPSDQDAYVQYEDGSGVSAGWDLSDLAVEWTNPYGLGGPGTTISEPTSQLQVEMNLGITPQPVGGTPIFPAIGSGTILGIYTAAYVNTTLGCADPGPASSVGLFVHDPNYATLPIAPSGDAYSVTGSASWGFSKPVFISHIPRFRYWKLTSPPLRQLQRDDGLVGSTFRHGGGTSRQGSIRQLGYY
jgi:hypothetical protein